MMRKTAGAIMGFVLCLGLAAVAHAAPVTSETPTCREMHHKAAKGTTVCPVSGEPMGTDEGIAYTYEGKEYRFCCPMCLEEFKKDPAKYIKQREASEQENKKIE